jgi:hypothetical protein
VTLDATEVSRPDRAAVLGVAAVGLYVGLLGWGMEHWPYDYWGGLLVAPVILAVSWPILAHIGRVDGDPWVAKVLFLALVVKLVASIVRYRTIFDTYSGSGDASVYDRNGRRLAPAYLAGYWNADVGWPHFIGAGFIIVVTAIVYILIQPTIIGAFFVFTWLSFWGLVFAYRAFRIALPEGNHRRYLVLLMFLPSLLFWPSSLGKDAWMGMAVGLSLYGCARLLVHRRGGIPVLLLGLAAALAVRPHIAALMVGGLAVGYIVRPVRHRTSLTPIIKVGGLIMVLALVGFVAQRAAGFLGVEDVSLEGVTKAVNHQSKATDLGNSSFTPAPATKPKNLPTAIVTVIFRPFPTEAHNLQTRIAASEGIIFLVLMLRSRRQLIGLPRLLRREPYLALCLTVVFGFIVAFSSFSNFGILARERATMWPLLLVLLCAPIVTRHKNIRPMLDTPWRRTIERVRTPA